MRLLTSFLLVFISFAAIAQTGKSFRDFANKQDKLMVAAYKECDTKAYKKHLDKLLIAYGLLILGTRPIILRNSSKILIKELHYMVKLIRCIFLMSFCVVSTNASAQLVVSLFANNTLYIGVNNHFDFAVKGFDTGAATVKASFGEIIAGEYGGFSWRICDDYSGKIVKFYAIDKKNEKVIDSIKFKVELMPAPSVRTMKPVETTVDHLSGDHGRNWPVELYLSFGLTTELQKTDYDFRCEVLEYDVRLIRDNIIYNEIKNLGYKYSEKTVDLLRQFRNGDTIVFDNIIAKCACEKFSRTLGNLIFTKKEGIIKMARN